MTLSFPLLNSWTYKWWLQEKQNHILDADSEPSREHRPSPDNSATKLALLLSLQKPTPRLYHASCFKVMGSMARSVNSVGRDRWPHLISEVIP